MATDNKDKPASPEPGVSRRGFFRGAGISSATAALSSSGLLDAQSAPVAARDAGPGRTTLVLQVNGERRELSVEPRTTLADALRTELGLTGTKVVCDRGSCCACTVLVDGTAVTSCMTLAIDVGTRAVTTIEGLATRDAQGNVQLHPVQAAFVEHDATMCGFCTPGMVMSCAALVRRNPNPTLDDVREATSGNLCRCGTYPKVFAATLAAAKAGGLPRA